MGKRPASGTPPSASKVPKVESLGPWSGKMLAAAQSLISNQQKMKFLQKQNIDSERAQKLYFQKPLHDIISYNMSNNLLPKDPKVGYAYYI